MPTIRHTLVALGATLIATAAFAQAAPDAGASAPDRHQRAGRMAERFKAADANNDGGLQLTELPEIRRRPLRAQGKTVAPGDLALETQAAEGAGDAALEFGLARTIGLYLAEIRRADSSARELT